MTDAHVDAGREHSSNLSEESLVGLQRTTLQTNAAEKEGREAAA